MKNSIRLLALLLVLVMSISVVACGGGTEESSVAESTADTSTETSTDEKANLDAVSDKKAPTPTIPDYKGGETLVVGYDTFSEKFSPFFATTAYDQDAAGIRLAFLPPTVKVTLSLRVSKAKPTSSTVKIISIPVSQTAPSPRTKTKPSLMNSSFVKTFSSLTV